MNKLTQWRANIRLSMMVLIISVILGGCAGHQASAQEASSSDAAPVEVYDNGDPFESVNRSIYQFNFTLDRWILKPVASFYRDYLPRPVRSGIGNFFSNLWEPNTMVNSLLQGKPYKAANSTARFILNSTVGLLGVFDVATPLGVAEEDEDFGQTLAVWGVGDGPYIMLPFLGPSNLRDTGGLVLQYALTDLVPPIFENPEQLFAAGVRIVDDRVDLLGADETLQLQVDPYLFLRESYRQASRVAIRDGALAELEEDPFEAELFKDE